MLIVIEGELTDLNKYIQAERTHRFKASKIKKDETERVAWEAKASKATHVTQYPVHISYDWYSKNSRMDIDNVAFGKKFVNDGLVLAGILDGDGRKHIAGFAGERFFIDKDRPRVEVVIHTSNGCEND